MDLTQMDSIEWINVDGLDRDGSRKWWLETPVGKVEYQSLEFGVASYVS